MVGIRRAWRRGGRGWVLIVPVWSQEGGIWLDERWGRVFGGVSTGVIVPHANVLHVGYGVWGPREGGRIRGMFKYKYAQKNELYVIRGAGLAWSRSSRRVCIYAHTQGTCHQRTALYVYEG